MKWKRIKKLKGERRFSCDDCHQSFTKVELAPELVDGAWLKFASKQELLCTPRMFNRAQAVGVELTVADLVECPINGEWLGRALATIPCKPTRKDWDRAQATALRELPPPTG